MSAIRTAQCDPYDPTRAAGPSPHNPHPNPYLQERDVRPQVDGAGPVGVGARPGISPTLTVLRV